MLTLGNNHNNGNSERRKECLMDTILTVFKASKHCNVSPKTIINWIEAGHIKA